MEHLSARPSLTELTRADATLTPFGKRCNKHHIREWRLNNIKTTCEHNRHHEVCAIIVSWKKEKRTEKRKRGSERGRRRAEKKACRNK
ncbi:uncharacterized protein LOC116840400 isoform X2 [Odontomachus brunneus]|uniref:uncharacterized protein LOC116840400 isoform X2 n=1 Tax=Odontomachus brunneus TaxID=486640 RepID=UPI0013F196E0|nr:uncharacterized protein LOC116840400 isoform X2 [Odontomachus brunneus]